MDPHAYRPRYSRHQKSQGSQHQERYPAKYDRFNEFNLNGARRGSLGPYGSPSGHLQSIREEAYKGERRGSEAPYYRPHNRDRRSSEDYLRQSREISRDYIPSEPFRGSRININENRYGSRAQSNESINHTRKKHQRSRRPSRDDVNTSTITTGTSTETGYSSSGTDIVTEDSKKTERDTPNNKPSEDTPKTEKKDVTIEEKTTDGVSRDVSLSTGRQNSSCTVCAIFKYIAIVVFICILGLIAYGIYQGVTDSAKTTNPENEPTTTTSANKSKPENDPSTTTVGANRVRRSLFEMIVMAADINRYS